MMKKVSLILFSTVLCCLSLSATIVHEYVNQSIDYYIYKGEFSSGQEATFLTINGTTFSMGYDDSYGITAGQSSNSPFFLMDSPSGVFSNNLKSFSSGEMVSPDWFVGLGHSSETETPGEENSGIRFIGLKTLENNYAWIQVDVNPGIEITIIDYGYETNADTPIPAGSTQGIVGVTENENFVDFKIIYSSINKILKIEASEFQTTSQLYDLAGNFLEDIDLNTIVDLNHLRPGIYILFVSNEKRKEIMKIQI